MNTTFLAPDIECGGCAASIEKALAGQAGIESVTVAVAEKRVTVSFDEAVVSREKIAAELDEIGFPVEVV